MTDLAFLLACGYLLCVVFTMEGLYMILAPRRYPPRPRWFMWRWNLARNLERMSEARRIRAIRIYGLGLLAMAAALAWQLWGKW